MRIYFENHRYNADLIEPYLGGMNLLELDQKNNKRWTERVGYLFVSKEIYSGPVFILPKSFLFEDAGNRHFVLGMEGIHPEDVIDTDDPKNPFEDSGDSTFLPELSLWLYRALNRFRKENEGTQIAQQASLDSQLPDDDTRDNDFLSTALDLIDFLKDHRNLFTQISLINNSGRNKIDWPKTVTGDPFFSGGEPWYLEPKIKDKVINIDDTLIILYYSVLKYLRDKYKFPVNLGEVPYTLLSVTEVQNLIDTGIGSKQMQRIRHHYFRDDLKHLWTLLDSFFTYNTTDEDKAKREEHLLVRDFHIVFEAMIDKLISDTHGVEELKKQDDGHLIDHIFKFKSLIDNRSDIYYIGDSKYYDSSRRPEGVALYKQFTYAKNTIQYHIDTLYLKHGQYPGSTDRKVSLRYRDTLTEGYNITPNFFVRDRATEKDIRYDKPGLGMTWWNKDGKQEYPETNKHFEDRLFDRDTLILREFSINLLFVIAAYAGYDESDWASEMRKTIRDSFIESVDKVYDFYILTPETTNLQEFCRLYQKWLVGKIYATDDFASSAVLAFEKTEKGQQDKQALDNARIRSLDTGEEVRYTLTPTTLKQLSRQ